jgi:hypothetical protein
MGDMHFNFLVVLVSGIVTMAVGALWYSPVLFAKQWMALNNMSADDMKNVNPAPMYAQTFVATLISYVVLAMAIQLTNATTIVDGMKTGFWIWLGFMTTLQFSSNVFSRVKIQGYFLDTSYQLVATLAAGALLAVWR